MHSRKALAAVAIAVSIATVAGFASAQQIYKWKDANGVTHFSQTPPATGTHYSKLRLDAEPEVSSNPAGSSAQPQTSSDADSGHAARSSAGATQPDTPANRAKFCQQLNSNIALLQGKQPVVAQGGNGKQEVLSDSAREQQLATARAQQAQYCPSKGV